MKHRIAQDIFRLLKCRSINAGYLRKLKSQFKNIICDCAAPWKQAQISI